MGINNALLMQAARGGRSVLPEMYAQGIRQANALREMEFKQANRNALANAAPMLAAGDFQGAMNSLGQAGQFDAVAGLDKTRYARGRDAVGDQRDARNFKYRQGRDAAGDAFRDKRFAYQQGRDAKGDAFRQQTFDANQDYRNQVLGLQRDKLTVAQQKAASKAKGKGKPTVDSAKSAGFYDRMVASEKALSNPDNVAAAMDRGNMAMDAAADLTRFRFGAGNLPKEYQKFNQAQRDFINAVLRRESGAVISEQEFGNARLQYFPQPGDTPEVIAQKAQNRAIVIEGMRRSGAPSFETEIPPGGVQQPASDLKSKYGLE